VGGDHVLLGEGGVGEDTEVLPEGAPPKSLESPDSESGFIYSTPLATAFLASWRAVFL
jgi:hypothetical protein